MRGLEIIERVRGRPTRHSRHFMHPQCHHAQPQPTRSSGLWMGSPQPQQRWRARMVEKHVVQKVGADVVSGMVG